MKQLNIPPLAEGETYIGAIGNKSGDVYHLVLLPGDNDRAILSNELRARGLSIKSDLTKTFRRKAT